MSLAETATIKIPRLPELDKEDIKAVRSFLPGKLLGRTAAMLSLVLLVLGFAIAVDAGLRQFLRHEIGISSWAYFGLLLGLPFLVVVAQTASEWRAERNRRTLQALAVKVGAEQTSYFRIAPYENTAADRIAFSRPDQAEDKVWEWIKKSTQIPLYLTGDSGSGKSSLLNASVLPRLREQGWTVVEARAWQDPQGALRDALLKLPDARRSNAGENPSLRELVEEAAKRAPDRILIVLDQFEEFVILAAKDQQRGFAEFITALRSRPVKDVTLLLVLRSDYQTLLEDIGLPPLRGGENLFQVARFRLSAANSFMKRSGLDLQPEALDRLLTSAAGLDETPGLVRPITLNVVGYVLASGRVVAPSLDAGLLVRRYIEQTMDQPAIRDRTPQILEQMVTEQGTKQQCSERQLVKSTGFRPAEVRAVMNSLGDATLARPLDATQGVWELSHDFVARAVARYLGRRRRRVLRRAGAYAAPALLAITLLAGAGVVVWNRLIPDRIRTELADMGMIVQPTIDGFIAKASEEVNDRDLAKAAPLLARLDHSLVLNLSDTQVTSLEPLEGLTALQSLDLSGTKVETLEPLVGLSSLRSLNLGRTKIENLEPLKGLSSLQSLNLGRTKIENLEPLKGLSSLQSLDLRFTKVGNCEPLKGLIALQSLNLGETNVDNIEPLKGLAKLRALVLGGTNVKNIEPIKGLVALEQLNLYGTRVQDLRPLMNLTMMRWLELSGTNIEDLEPLKSLTALETLNLVWKQVQIQHSRTGGFTFGSIPLSRTTVENLEPLKGLTRLRSLNLLGTNIENLEPIKGLTALQSLDVSFTKVANLKSIKGLTKLQSLALSGTRVENLEPLKGLAALQSLNLMMTEVENLEPLKGLTALQSLDLRETKAKDLEPLDDLTALKSLNLNESGLEAELARLIRHRQVNNLQPVEIGY